MTYFANIKTLEELKKAYKKLVFELHPDVSGRDTEKAFQQMQNEYDNVFARVKNIHQNSEGETYTKENNEMPDVFKDLVAQLATMNGVDVEIIGTFVWLSGQTLMHKDRIKALGFRWSSNKKMWYKAPENYRKTSRKKYEIGELREMFGTQTYSAKPMPVLT